jgi:alpha-galactosidase
MNEPAFHALHGRDSSLVIEAPAGEAPLWRYWGPRLPEGVLPPGPLRDARTMPSFTLDHDQPLSVFPTFGIGGFMQSALLAHRDGRAFAQAITQCSVEPDPLGNALTLRLVDGVAAIEVVLVLQLDRTSDVLAVRTTLRNTGTDLLDVQWLAAATLPLPGLCETVRSYAGQHLQEFQLQVEPLGRSLWRRENRRGRTSHDCFPGAVIATPGADGASGLVYGAHLAWSGNHQQTIEWVGDGQYQWQLGEWLAPGEGRLAAGAVLAAPELVASCSRAGFDGLAANFHDELRSRQRWPGGAMAPRPVHLNTWEGLYFDVRPEPLKALAEAAARVGIERFVLDDGWFHGRHDDRRALGDWWPDAGKFPHGLGEVIAQVQALGMQFGLWVEPEMVSPDSELFRAHPEYALQLEGRPLLTGRNQLVLDIARPAVAELLFERIATLLRAHPIGYLKWDHNRDLTTAGLANGQAGYRAQVHALYGLLGRLRAEFPAVEIESCSGGGGRIDFAVLRHTHRVWTSDCIDALARLPIQSGFLQFFPPEIMGAHVGASPAHTTGRVQTMDFRAAVALPGHLGVELDLRTLDADSEQTLARWIGLYKRWRGLLHSGRVWRGELPDALVWQAHGPADGRELLLFVWRTAPGTHRYPPPLRLPMLQQGASYRARLVEPEGRIAPAGRHHTAPLFDALREPEGARFAGAWLAQAGLPLARQHAETALLVHLVREG